MTIGCFRELVHLTGSWRIIHCTVGMSASSLVPTQVALSQSPPWGVRWRAGRPHVKSPSGWQQIYAVEISPCMRGCEWVACMHTCVCVSHLGACVIASRRTPFIYYLFTLKVDVVNTRYTCRYDMRCDNVKNVWHFNGPLSVHCEPEGKFSPETECLQDCSIVSLRAVNKFV